jgi:hypothetical protein
MPLQGKTGKPKLIAVLNQPLAKDSATTAEMPTAFRVL